MARFYLDTDVWIAYFDAEDERHGSVVELFKLLEKQKHTILVSNTHLLEIQKTKYFDEFQKVKRRLFYEGKCLGISVQEADRHEAHNLNKKVDKGYRDCLHLLTAIRNDTITISLDAHWQELGSVLGKKVFTVEEALKQFRI